MVDGFTISRDGTFTTLNVTQSFKLPLVNGLNQLGDNAGLEGTIVLDAQNGNLCYHDGLSWKCLDQINSLKNIGGGAGVYVESSGPNPFELKSLLSSNNRLSIIPTEDNIVLNVDASSPWTVQSNNFIQNLAFPDAPIDFGSNNLLFGSDGLDSAYTGATGLTGATGTTKMFFIADKSTLGLGSFRAGTVTGNQWDAENRGNNSVAFGLNNIANNTNTFVGGGQNNIVSGTSAFIGAGKSNNISGRFSSIGAGSFNNISGWYSAIGAGQSNSISGLWSAIGAGQFNSVSGERSAIGGGMFNNISKVESAIGAGQFNNISGDWSSIGAGFSNTISGKLSSIGAGQFNIVSGLLSSIGAGGFNNVSAYYSSIGAGQSNNVSGTASFIGAGGFNNVSAYYSSIGAGQSNNVSGDFSSIGAGERSSILGENSSIGAGEENSILGNWSSIGAGSSNTISGDLSAIGAGSSNTIFGRRSAIGAGVNNNVEGNYSAIGAGQSNTIFGTGSFIGAGSTNNILDTASNSSIIAGTNLTLEQPNTTLTKNFRSTGGMQLQSLLLYYFDPNILNEINLTIENHTVICIFATSDIGEQILINTPNDAVIGQRYYIKSNSLYNTVKIQGATVEFRDATNSDNNIIKTELNLPFDISNGSPPLYQFCVTLLYTGQSNPDSVNDVWDVIS